jgi:hypothetical protein
MLIYKHNVVFIYMYTLYIYMYGNMNTFINILYMYVYTYVYLYANCQHIYLGLTWGGSGEGGRQQEMCIGRWRCWINALKFQKK